MTTTAAPSAGDPAEVARQMVVVYFTYGVEAAGYPPWEEVIAPEARPSVRSQIVDADYANAGCVQIVKAIEVEPLGPNRFRAQLTLAYVNCSRPPTFVVDGSALPTEVQRAVEVQVGPSPTGGLWGTEISFIDPN